MPSIAFVTHVHDGASLALLEAHIKSWMYFHPEAKILIIEDGYDMGEFCGGYLFNVELISDWIHAKLKQPPYIAWLNRAFDSFYDYTDADYMIRLDPDTVCHRRIEKLPRADMFGTLIKGKFPHIQGGCVGFSRKLAKAFCDLRKYEKLIEPEIQRPDCSKNEHYSDLVLYDIISKQLPDMTIANWKEVNCHAYTEPKKLNCKQNPEPWAFTHPHKELA